MRPGYRWLLTVCFLVSGATSLVLEVAWFKQLSYILGNTLYAMATLVAAFMAGLGLGSGLGGRWGERLTRPLRAYAAIQFGIGLCGMLSIPVFRATEPLFRTVYHVFEPGHAAFLSVRFGLVLVLMIIPTSLMGMTLPVVVGALARRRAAYDPEAGTLYGVNTLGAVIGTFGAGFVILQFLGLWKTGLATGLVDIAVGCAALWLDRRVGPIDDIRRGERAKPQSTGTRGGGWNGRQWVVGLVFGVSGAVAMVYEVGWFRLLALTVGPSVYSFAAMLGVFLAGIGLGSVLAAPWAERKGLEGVWGMAACQGGLALVSLAALQFANALPEIFDQVFRGSAGRFGDAALILAQTTTAALIVFPPTLLMGALFPVAVRAIRESGRDRSPETNVGRLYMLNTIGAVAGSLVAGFVVLQRLGAWNTVALAGLASAMLSTILFLIARSGVTAVRFGPALAIVPLAALLVVSAPVWDVALFNLGLYRNTYQGLETDLERTDSATLIFYREGINAPVAVYNFRQDGSLRVSGKPDASTTPLDLYTQGLAGHLPVIFASSPKRAAMIGYGSGMTAAAILAHPEVERLDIVEIEQGVIDASPFFECTNDDPFDDPRTRLILEDGRVQLTYADHPYDVITSEPSNPWMAGVANLFTTDFYRIVRARLAPGGIFAQHLQSYEITEDVFASVVASILDSFPHVILVRTTPNDNILLASAEPISLEWDVFRSRTEIGSVQDSLRRLDILRPAQILFFFRAGNDELAELAGQAPILSTDDNGLARAPHAPGTAGATRARPGRPSTQARSAGHCQPAAVDAGDGAGSSPPRGRRRDGALSSHPGTGQRSGPGQRRSLEKLAASPARRYEERVGASRRDRACRPAGNDRPRVRRIPLLPHHGDTGPRESSGQGRPSGSGGNRGCARTCSGSPTGAGADGRSPGPRGRSRRRRTSLPPGSGASDEPREL